MADDGITLDGAGQAVGRFIRAVDQGRTGETDPASPDQRNADNTPPPPPPATRDEAQRERTNLIEAILMGDRAAVDGSLGRFESLAQRFGLSSLFDQIKSFIDSIMGSGSPVTNEDATRVRTMTDGLIDQTLPAPDPAPVNTR